MRKMLRLHLRPGVHIRGVGCQLDQSKLFFFSSRRRHTRFDCDWSSDVCSSDLEITIFLGAAVFAFAQSNWPKLDYSADPNWPRLPAGWTFEETPGVAVDSREHVFEIGRASCRERV